LCDIKKNKIKLCEIKIESYAKKIKKLCEKKLKKLRDTKKLKKVCDMKEIKNFAI